MSEKYDTATGEVISNRATIRQTLSDRAMAASIFPGHWAGRVEPAPVAILGEGGREFEAAFYLCQEELLPWIVSDSNNPFLKTKYASLPPLLMDIRNVLTKNFMTIKQYPGKIHRAGVDGGKTYFLPVCTKITHVVSGQFEVFVLEMPMEKTSAHEVGSLLTYGRRYSLLGIFGIAATDDDAAAAVLKRTIENDDISNAMKLLLGEIHSKVHKAELKSWAEKERDITAFPEARQEELREAYRKKLSELPDAPPQAERKTR